MITLEIGQLYGMNSIKEVLDAAKKLQDFGMPDADIQAVLDRSRDSTCKGWGGEGMTKEENLHWLNQEIQTWENECQSKHPIKEALYAARKSLKQEPTLEKDGTLIVTTEHYKNVGRVLVQCGTNGTLFYQDQEPIKPMVEIDLYSVFKQKYIEREVLEKLRADIEATYDELDGYDPDALGTFASRIDDLIDNLLSESEVKANGNEK